MTLWLAQAGAGFYSRAEIRRELRVLRAELRQLFAELQTDNSLDPMRRGENAHAAPDAHDRPSNGTAPSDTDRATAQELPSSAATAQERTVPGSLAALAGIAHDHSDRT